jgi:hypothetical protein
LLCFDTWQVVCDVFRLQNQLPDAARIAIRLGDQVGAAQYSLVALGSSRLTSLNRRYESESARSSSLKY